ncbi:MAG: hypothetical protein ACRYG2_15175, partial [Janthinobacterium lividum]
MTTGPTEKAGPIEKAGLIEEPAPEELPPVPVVAARHLGLVGLEGAVFTDVSLDVLPGRLTV